VITCAPADVVVLPGCIVGVFGGVRVCGASVVAWVVAGRPLEEVAFRAPKVALGIPAVTEGVEFPLAILVGHVAPVCAVGQKLCPLCCRMPGAEAWWVDATVCVGVH
jgi:hypothetical protein